MPQKVVSPAFAIGGEVMRNGCVGYRVKPERKIKVIERLREQIRCIEGRTPTLEPVKPATVQALEAVARIGHGSADDTADQMQSTHGTASFGTSLPDQTGVPAVRFVHEDGGALFPRNAPAPSSSSFLLSRARAPRDHAVVQPAWTLDDAPEGAHALQHDLTRLALDEAGVHEIKPAGDVGDTFDERQGPAASRGMSEVVPGAMSGAMSGTMSGTMSGLVPAATGWSAARAFALMLMARRCHLSRRPVMWCMPRSARIEHGLLYSHGLRRFGLTPADVLIVETGNAQDTLWALEEGLKSESLALVAGHIDDVALTPARRLALAAQKHVTPCLLLTHPRMPPVAATATRWRAASTLGAAHPLAVAPATTPMTPMTPMTSMAPRRQGYRHGLGARRLALTLERYRMVPGYAVGTSTEHVTKHVIGREHIMEWSDEAVCLRLASELSDRPDAAPMPARGA